MSRDATKPHWKREVGEFACSICNQVFWDRYEQERAAHERSCWGLHAGAIWAITIDPRTAIPAFLEYWPDGVQPPIPQGHVLVIAATPQPMTKTQAIAWYEALCRLGINVP